MKIFISWSGEASKKVALGLKDWIPYVINAIEPFVSDEDIQKGSRWFAEICSKLEEIDFCIVCLTTENMNEPWILFEAGASSKKLEQSRVVPLLIGMSKADLQGPLAQFQATTTEKDEIKKLVKTLNIKMTNNKLEESKLDNAFEKWWPDLDAKFNEAMSIESKKVETPSKKKRSNEDILEELLELTRSIARQVSPVSIKGIEGKYPIKNLFGSFEKKDIVEYIMAKRKLNINEYDIGDRNRLNKKIHPIIFGIESKNAQKEFVGNIMEILNSGNETEKICEDLTGLIYNVLMQYPTDKLVLFPNYFELA